MGIVKERVSQEHLVHEVRDGGALATEHRRERYVIIVTVLWLLDMPFLDVHRVFLEEELGKLTDLFGHLEAHHFAIALDLSDRVARRQTSQWGIVNV